MVDATETEEIAKRMRAAGARTKGERDFALQEGDGGFPPGAVVLVFLAVTGAVYGASLAGIKGGLPVHLPAFLDKRFGPWLSAHPPTPTGSPADAILAAAAQAAAICLAALVLPVAVLLWRRGRDVSGGNLFISFWGVSVGLPFAVVLLKDFLWPLIRDMFGLGS
jgi:hypothetical protein